MTLTNAKIGCIGLGNVGIHLASNFIKAGYSVLAYDMRKERIKLLAVYIVMVQANQEKKGLEDRKDINLFRFY